MGRPTFKVPSGKCPILIATHSPFYYADRGIIPRRRRIVRYFENHPVSLISGHTHLNSNHEIKPGIIEHNIGAILEPGGQPMKIVTVPLTVMMFSKLQARK